MEKLNYSQYIEKTIYQNIFDLQNWYVNARYKILSMSVQKKNINNKGSNRIYL